jgi:hypothetical protein
LKFKLKKKKKDMNFRIAIKYTQCYLFSYEVEDHRLISDIEYVVDWKKNETKKMTGGNTCTVSKCTNGTTREQTK